MQLPPSSEITLKLPDTIEVIEAVIDDASSSSYRSSDKVIITDGRSLLYFPPGEEDGQKFSEYVKRPLNISDIEDRKITRRLIEKALDIGIRKITQISFLLLYSSNRFVDLFSSHPTFLTMVC